MSDIYNSPGRSNVRVPAYFALRYSIPKDPDSLLLEIESHRTSDRFCTPPTAFTDLPADLTELNEFQETQPHIYRMWMTLERKLDYLIHFLNEDVYNDPDMDEAFCINLSAGGVRIRTPLKPAPDAVYLVRMAPPTFPALLVEALATVIESTVDEEREGHFLVSFSFTAINLQDQEDLISYLFKRQREILRNKSGS